MSLLHGFLYIPLIMMWLFLLYPIGSGLAGETGDAPAIKGSAEIPTRDPIGEQDLELLENLEFLELMETLQFMEMDGPESVNDNGETSTQDNKNEE